MKRIVFWMVALLLMSGVAMAQANRQGGRQQMDPKTRAQRMTERMVKEWNRYNGLYSFCTEFHARKSE